MKHFFLSLGYTFLMLIFAYIMASILDMEVTHTTAVLALSLTCNETIANAFPRKR